MARRARGNLKDEAKAKARNKAKLEKAAALTVRTRLRTMAGPGNVTPTPGGINPEPSGGQQKTALRPVPRRKRKRNKELSLATKVGMSVPPINVPASCRWGTNCARRGLM